MAGPSAAPLPALPPASSGPWLRWSLCECAASVPWWGGDGAVCQRGLEEGKAAALRLEREARKAKLAMERQLAELASSKGQTDQQLEEERKKNVANMGLVSPLPAPIFTAPLATREQVTAPPSP